MGIRIEKKTETQPCLLKPILTRLLPRISATVDGRMWENNIFAEIKKLYLWK
jgi:hypothetical protein